MINLSHLLARLDRDIESLKRGTDAAQDTLDSLAESTERLGRAIRDGAEKRRVQPYEPSQPAKDEPCKTQE